MKSDGPSLAGRQAFETAGPISVHRREWFPEAMLLIGAVGLVTVIFGLTPLDMAAARVFYRPGGPDHWPLAQQFPWSCFYQMAPAITASLIVFGLVGLVAGQVYRQERWLAYGIFLILCVVIGPGLIINASLKDHWDRPRPRDVAAFGGPLHYTPAPLRGEGGASFPCGHCSVGFLYAAGWWLWRRRRPRRARASLALGLLVGFALGLGRMAAGGHFLSDVCWSALLAFGTAHILYYYVLRIPAVEARELSALDARPRRQWIITTLATLGAAAVLIALFVTPHGRRFTTKVDLASLSRVPRVLEVTARAANIEILIGDFPATQILVDCELHGFGFPTSRLDASAEFQADPVPTLSYRIEERGWIVDLDASAIIRVPPGDFQRIVIRLKRGNIRVADTTKSRVVYYGRLKLDLRTEAGHVQQPDQ